MSVSPLDEMGSEQSNISDVLNSLGNRALKYANGDWIKSEAAFNKYINMINKRLELTGSKFRVEIQPAIKMESEFLRQRMDHLK